MRRLLLLLAVAVAVASVGAPAAHGASPVKHVFVLVLENKDYDDSFGSASEAPYLARELTSKGQLLSHYFGTSHASLGNYVTMVSGQAPNLETQGDCPLYIDVLPASPAPNGQINGIGCVYPRKVATVVDQLEERGLKWRGYMEDIPRPCYHPAFGGLDPTQSANRASQYATRHNPFAYFRSIIDDPSCVSNVVTLDRLPGDLRSVATTPNYVFITPDLCNDGHDEPCVDGRPGGLPSSDAFLKRWVPQITASPAFRKDGLLLITWDEANIGSTGACCGEVSGPNTSVPGLGGPGGGRSGAVVLSPFTKAGTINPTPYNHYSLLRSVEDIFGLPHLGLAAAAGLKPFGADVLNKPAAKPRAAIKLLSSRRIPGCTAANRGVPVGGARAGRPARGKTVVAVRTRRRAAVALAVRSGRRVLRSKTSTSAACRRLRFGVPRVKGTVAVHARAGRARVTRRVRLRG